MSIRTTAAEAVRPLVLALDIGSSATRGGLYDAGGREVRDARHKVPHSFDTDDDGASTIDPDLVVAEVGEVLAAVTENAEKGSVAAVALDTFASSLVGVDATGRAVTPCYTYADSRCSEQVAQLRSKLDEAEVLRRTGTRIHASYLAPRLRWLRQTDRDLFDRVARWMSLPEYVHLRLLGTTAAGTSTAAWTGLLNRRTGEWDTQLVRLAGIEREHLSRILDPSVPITPTPKAQRKINQVWPALKDAVWLPGVADGLSATIGTGGGIATGTGTGRGAGRDIRTTGTGTGTTAGSTGDGASTDGTGDDIATGGAASGTAVISAGTSGAVRILLDRVPESLPPGVWCYRVDQGRSLVGGALNDVGRAITWLQDTFRLPEDTALDDVLHAEPSDSTPLVLPFLSGERSTGWAAQARASMLGLSASHTPLDVARGMLEGLALAYGRLARQLWELTGLPQEIRVSGGVLNALPTFPQLLADVLGVPVVTAATKRATLRGTALLALDAVAPDAGRAPVPARDRFEPVPSRSKHFARRLDELEEAYRAVVTL